MLLRAIHMPLLYDEVPSDPDVADLYCSALLTLLEDTTRNGILFVDSDNLMFDVMDRGISNKKKWQVTARKRAQEYLELLERRNRLVRIEPVSSTEASCGGQGCAQSLTLARQERPDTVITRARCTHCDLLQSNGIWATSLHDYAASSFRRNRNSAESVELADGEWDKKTFEQQVWAPVFRYAKHVKLFDRMLGHHLTGKLERGKPLSPGRQLEVGRNFTRGLEWTFAQFLAHAPIRPSRRFEVTCGLDATQFHESVLKAAASALRQYANDLSEKYGFAITMHVKRERTDAALRHARFIITDQIALVVERGFDLLRSDDKVRDVIINHVQNPEKIEREARDLIDVQ
jgi:hypothetical protein